MRFKRFIQNCTLSLGLLLASASATAESPRNLEDILSKPSQEKHEVSSDVLDLDKKVKDYNRNTIQPKLNERERRRRAAELERQKKEEEKRYLSSLGEKLPNLTEYILLKKDNYNISFEIKIEKGGVLEIEPGTRLSFMPNCGIVCYGGRLVAKGTPRDKITFRATEKRWGNITLVGTRSFLEDCVITEGSGRAEKDVLFGWYYKGGPKVMLSDKDIRIGGGLLLVNDGSFVRDCEIYGNNAEKGGGVYLKSTGSERFRSEAIFDNNIHDNTAKYGGGIYIKDGGVIIKNNTIKDNKATSNGGGIYVSESCVDIDGNKITSNKSPKRGAAIRLGMSTFILQNNRITGNRCDEGGAVSYYYSHHFPPGSKEISSFSVYSSKRRAPEVTSEYLRRNNNTISGNYPINIKQAW